MNLIPKDTDYVIPPLRKEGEKRSKSAIEVNQQPLLYDLTSMDQETNRFDYFSPAEGDNNVILRDQAPALLALKNKTAKANIKKPVIVLTPGAVPPDQIRNVPTLITSKPLQPLPVSQNTLAEKIQKEKELEQNGLDFTDDPVAYFFKHKDGRGHLFIYLIFERPRSDPLFSPYQLKKVTHSELTPEFFTMSSNGVTHMYPDGSSETVSLDRWARVKTLFSAIQKLGFFKKFHFWKPFKQWKKFVKMQRYTLLRSKILEKSLYKNENFYSYLVLIMKETCENILKDNLLSIISQKKYKLDEYIKESNAKIDNLISKYNDFINRTVDKMKQLDSEIRDPQRVLVKETDFQRNKSIIPNLGQLMVLNEKMNAERARRNEIVHNEVIEFGNFIRLIDYIEVETLSSTCLKCWKIAESNITQEMSAIFQVEIMFNEEGKIVFTPKIEELKKTISDSLDNAIQVIDSLPRILKVRELNPHLRETVGNVDLLLDNRLKFTQCVKSNPAYKVIQKNILDTIEKSYHEAEKQSQKFVEFYNIYKLGKTWKASDYLYPRGGTEKLFDLTKFATDFDREPEPITYDPSKELIVDFKKIGDDVLSFKKEELRINQFRSASVRGALFIDSKNLRAELTPIPVKSMQAIQNILLDLLNDKIEHINSIFRFSAKRLKKEPNSLIQYVDNSEFLNMITELNQLIKIEIKFVDDLISLLDRLGFANRTGEHSRNPLYQSYKVFQQDLQCGLNIRESNRAKYVDELTREVNNLNRSLNSFKCQIDNVPQDIVNSDINDFIKTAKNLKYEVNNIEPQVVSLNRCQEIMNVKIKDLSSFSQLKESIDFIMQIYDLTKDWQEIATTISTIPFSDIDINKFGIDLNNLNNRAESLLQMKVFDSSLLNTIHEKINSVLPYMEQLELLSTSKMHFHHWSKLFEECGQAKGYYAQIKIEEMIANGVLQQKDKIENITSISLGESQLETEFNELANEWKDVHLPLIDSQIKSEDSLLLGDLSELYRKIIDSQLRLHRMLALPFVQGLREQITTLSSQLDYYNKVLEAWSKFQSSWVILASFFAPEETKKAMQQEANKFMIVRRRWVNLVRHTLENTALYHVCSFASLLEMLVDNNNCLEQICSNVLKKIDCKRLQFPRLFFLSNTDVLAIFSTTDFSVMNRLMTKMFMHIKCFETHPLDETELALQQNLAAQNFQRMKVYGMTGESLDTLVFTRNVVLAGSIDSWGQTMLDVMKQSIMAHISESIYKFTNSSLIDWVSSAPIYIAILTLQVAFTRDIEECFNNFENNVHSFDQYKGQIENKIKELGGCIKKLKSAVQINKIGSLITLLCYQLDKIEKMRFRKANYSQHDYWCTLPHLKFNSQTSQITVENMYSTWEHGYEFWGESRQMIMTPESDVAISNVLSALSSSSYSLLFGHQNIGRKLLLSNIAALFGRFVFFAPSFKDDDSVFFQRLLTGAVGSGTWLVFNNIDQADESNLSNISRYIQSIKDAKASAASQITIGPNTVRFAVPFRVFFTGGESCAISNKIPDCIKTNLQPAAFPSPDLNTIAKINLMASGFTYVEYLSKQLVEFVKLFRTLFTYVSNKPIITDILAVISEGLGININMVSSGKAKELNVMDTESIEILSIATSLTYQYQKKIKEEHYDIFFKTLYSHLNVLKSVTEFKAAIEKVSLVHQNELIKDILENCSSEIIYEGPFKSRILDYIKEFLYALPNNVCIILTGDTWTGKSYIIEIISKCLNKMRKDTNFIKKYPSLLPFKVVDVFFRSDVPEKFYGYSNYDETGPNTVFGLLHSYANQFENLKGFEKFIRLNGPLDKEAVRFIREMLTSGDSPRIILNTMQTFNEESNIHILIETDSIENLDPSVIGCSKIITFDSINTKIPVSPSGAPSFDADFIFMKAVNSMKTSIPVTTLKTFKSQFSEIAPHIIKYIFNTPNQIWSYPTSLFVKGGDAVIVEQLPYYALSYSFLYLQDSQADPSNSSHTKYLLLHSFFLVYSAIIDQNSISNFDNWMRNNFLIKIPSDWVGFDVPQHFWDAFPRPTLLSVRFNKDQMLPLDYSLLNQPPIVAEHLGQQHFSLTDDITVCTAQFLPAIQEASILIKMRQNFILSGSNCSGKTSCIKYMFANPEYEATPIFIPVSTNTTATDLISFIKNHTPIISRIGSKPLEGTAYALVFENVPPQNTMALEFIRGLVTHSFIYQFSQLDPKYLDILPLSNYFVVVTTNSIADISPRFSSLFMTLRLFPLSVNSMRHIFSVVAQHFNISKEIYEPAFLFTEKCAHKQMVGFNFIHLLDIFCMLPNRTSPTRKDYLDCIRALLSELKTLHAHKLTTSDELYNFSSIFHTIFADADVQLLYESIMSGTNLYYPEIEPEEETKNLVAYFNFHQQHLIREELVFLLSQFNSKTVPKPKLNFFKPIIQQWIYFQRLLLYPGRNILIVGPQGSGRFSLSAFTAITKGYDFIHITPRVPSEKDNDSSRAAYLNEQMNKLILNVFQTNKKFVVFFRANSENDFDYQFLSPLFQNCNFLPFIKEEERKDIYSKATSQFSQLLDHPHLIYDHLRYIIKTRVKFIIESNTCFLTHYRNFQVLRIEIETIESIENCASDALQNQSFKKGLGDLPPNLPKAIASMHMNIASRFPIFEINHYYDFIKTFMYFFKNRITEIEEHKENLKNALDFFEDTGKLAKEMKKKLDKLHPSLDNMSGNDEDAFKAFIAKKDTIKVRIQKIHDTEAQQLEQVKNLEQETEKLKTEIISLKVKVDLDRGKVEGISQQTLNGLRLIDGSRVKCVGLLIEMLLAFMGMNTSYEPYGRRLINDPKFIQNILNRIKGTEFNPKYLSDVNDYLGKLKPMRQEMDRNNPAIGIIFDWISDTYDACVIDSKVADKTNQLNGYRLQLKKFLEDSEIEKESIKQVSASIDEEMEKYKNSIEGREKEKQEFLSVKENYAQLENLLKGSDRLVDMWMNECASTKRQMELAITDTILFAAFVVYFGAITKQQQEEIMNEAFESFETFNLPYNKDMTIKDLHCALKLADSDDLNFDRSSFFETELNCRRIKFILRPPLIIDSDGAIRSYLLKTIKPKKLVQISTYSSNLRSTIIDCMETGKSLIIYDVDGLTSYMFSLLQLPLSRDEEINFPIYDKVVKVSPKFKYFLFTSLRKLDSIPSDISSRSTIINMSTTSTESISLIIAQHFVEVFNQEKSPRIINTERLGMQRAVELHKYEDEALDTIAGIRMASKENKDYDILSDPDTIDSTVRSMECYLSALAGKTDFKAISKEMDEILKPYKESIKLCTAMWITLSRYLPRIKRAHLFQFNKFLEVIDKALQEAAETQNTNEELKNIIVKHVIRYIVPQVSFVDGYVFLFISVVMADHTEKQFKGFDDNLLHIRDELSDVCDMRNSEITRGDPLEQLKFANISSIFPIIRSYLIEKIGPQFEDHFPCSSLSQFISDSPTVPTIIQTKHQNILSTMLHGKKKPAKKPLILSLSCSQEFVSNVMEKAKVAIEEGITLVLFYSSTSRSATIVEDIFEMINQPHKDFKLIILCSSFKELPQTILMGSTRISYDTFPSIRHTMYRIFSNNPSIISGSSSPQIMKKLSFPIAMNYALTKARQFFTPLGTYIMPQLSESTIRVMLEKTSKFIDKIQNNDFPFLNLQERFNTSIVGAYCLDRFDAIKLQEETGNLLTIKWLSNNVLFRGYEWFLDREWEVQKYIELCKSLPIYPTPALLGMDHIASAPIFNWRLSNWIAKPLAKMAKEISILPSDVRAKLESLATMIPPAIQLPAKYEVQTPLSFYLLDEINKFNEATREINFQISNAVVKKNEKVFDFIAQSRVPTAWKILLGYSGTDNITKFFSMMFDKSRFLLNWLKLPTTPNEIDLRYLRDIPGFLEAYHTEIAMQRGVPRDALKLQFSFQPTKESGIGLINAALMGANWDSTTGSIIKSNQKTQSFARIQMMTLVCIPSLTPDPQGVVVPLLKNIPKIGYTDAEKPFENNISNVIVQSTLSQQELILSGVAIICHVHDTFC